MNPPWICSICCLANQRKNVCVFNMFGWSHQQKKVKGVQVKFMTKHFRNHYSIYFAHQCYKYRGIHIFKTMSTFDYLIVLLPLITFFSHVAKYFCLNWGVKVAELKTFVFVTIIICIHKKKINLRFLASATFDYLWLNIMNDKMCRRGSHCSRRVFYC